MLGVSQVDADLVAHPRYVRRDVPELHLFYTGSAWRIVRGSDDPSGELLAEAVSAALHPATVGVSGWSLLEAETGAVRHCPEYEMVCDGPNTELQPFLMEELAHRCGRPHLHGAPSWREFGGGARNP